MEPINAKVDMRASHTVDNLIYLFFLDYPEIDAETLYKIWETNVILKEYKRPALGYIKLLITIYTEELEQKGIKIN